MKSSKLKLRQELDELKELFNEFKNSQEIFNSDMIGSSEALQCWKKKVNRRLASAKAMQLECSRSKIEMNTLKNLLNGNSYHQCQCGRKINLLDVIANNRCESAMPPTVPPPPTATGAGRLEEKRDVTDGGADCDKKIQADVKQQDEPAGAAVARPKERRSFRGKSLNDYYKPFGKVVALNSDSEIKFMKADDCKTSWKTIRGDFDDERIWSRPIELPDTMSGLIVLLRLRRINIRQSSDNLGIGIRAPIIKENEAATGVAVVPPILDLRIKFKLKSAEFYTSPKITFEMKELSDKFMEKTLRVPFHNTNSNFLSEMTLNFAVHNKK